MFKAAYLGKSLGYFVEEERAGVAVDEHIVKHEFRLKHPLNTCVSLLEYVVCEVEREGRGGQGKENEEDEAFRVGGKGTRIAAAVLRRQPLTFPNKTGEVDGVWEHEQKSSRQNVLQKQWKEAEKLVKRMVRLDRYALFSENSNLRICLADIELSVSDPQQSPYALPVDDDEAAVLDWKRLLKDVEVMCKDAIRKTGEVEGFKVKRWLQSASQMAESAKEKLHMQLRQCEIEEKLDELQEQNQEPAVQGKWIKTPFDITRYERVDGYIANRGLPKNERALVMQKIITQKPSEPKPSGLKLDTGSINHSPIKNGNRYVHAGEQLNGGNRKVHRRAMIKEKNVWGIDCFTKRNIQLAVDVSEARLAEFLRCKLLPALNAQADEVSHNMMFALELICKDKEDEDLCAAIVGSIEMFGHHNFRVWPKGRAVIALENIPKDT